MTEKVSEFSGGDDVGIRLQQLRNEFEFSQRQLSKRSSVANATISQIESGALNPTIGTLRKILSGFPISLAAFFSDDLSTTTEQTFYRMSELTELSEGSVSYRQVGNNLLDRAIQFLWERYEPGGDTGRHALSHEGEECGFVISGELTVTVAGESRTLTAGEAYYFNSDQPHTFKNEGGEPCELISACTPPSF